MVANEFSGYRGTRAVQHLVEHAPCTGGLALWVRHQDLDDEADARTGASMAVASPVVTDGITLFYTPAFSRQSLALQAGGVAHGVLHIALRHPQRMVELRQVVGDLDERLFNTCADAIVNSSLAHLPWLSLAPGAVRLHALLQAALGSRIEEAQALAEWDLERLYRALDDRAAPQQGKRPAKAGNQGGGASPAPAQRHDGPRAAAARALGRQTAPDLLPGTDGAGGTPEEQAALAREWIARLERAHAGDGEFSMLRGLPADMPATRTPWEQLLRTRLARDLAPRPALSWSRPSRSYIANQGRAGPGRRMPWEPGRSATQPVPRLAVVVDVSGSVDAELLARFTQEIEAIARRLEAALVLIVGDDRVRLVKCFEPGEVKLGEIPFEGGGGTDFTPLLQEALRHRPDAAVVLTDLQGPAAFKPPWPVLWAVPAACHAAEPPFGRKLVLA
jgi:hypothetical protein